jgi:hypothetical protein
MLRLSALKKTWGCSGATICFFRSAVGLNVFKSFLFLFFKKEILSCFRRLKPHRHTSTNHIGIIIKRSNQRPR